MANDANGIGGGPPRRPGLPPPPTRPAAAGPRAKPAAALRGNNKAPAVPPRQHQSAATARTGERPNASSRANASTAATASRAASEAFATERARDGVDAQQDPASAAARAAHRARAGEEANLRRVAQDETLDPLVLPPPGAPPINPQQAAQLLARLAALSAPVAALQASTAANRSAATPNAGEPTAATNAPDATDASGATGLGTSPDAGAANVDASGAANAAILRYAKNELGLTPKALRMFGALLTTGASGAGAGGAAVPAKSAPDGAANNAAPGAVGAPHATVDASVPASRGPAGAQEATRLAAQPPPQATPNSPGAAGGATDNGPTRRAVFDPATSHAPAPPIDARSQTTEVKTVSGETLSFGNSDPYALKYHGTMNWAVFSRLVTRDQLQAVFDLILLRQIDIGWQNYVQNQANELDVLTAAMQIGFKRVEAQMTFVGSVLDAKAGFQQGPSRLLRNQNANKSTEEDELNMKLESNTKGPKLRADLVDLSDKLRTRQAQERGPITQRDDFSHDILDTVPAVRAANGAASVPERSLARVELTNAEKKNFSGSEAQQYRDLENELKHESEMDASLRYGRLSHEASQLEQAAAQTRAASAAEAALNDPERAARYAKLADAYDTRAKELRQRADQTGYLDAVPSAHRANRRQFADSINTELRDLDKLQEQHASVQAKLQDATGEAREKLKREERRLSVAIEDRQFRLGGMHAAVVTVENAQGKTELGPTVSGSSAVVQRVRRLLDALRGRPVGTPAHGQAEGALDAFLRTLHPNAARSALLSEAFRRGTQPSLRGVDGPLRAGAPEPVRAAGNALEAPDTTPQAAATHAKTIGDWLQSVAPEAGQASGGRPPAYGAHVPAPVQQALQALQAPNLSPADQARHAGTVGTYLRQGIPPQVLAATAALGDPNLTSGAAVRHAATLDAWLRTDQPRYAEHLPNVNKVRMDRHTDQRARWDQDAAAELPAERNFWRHNEKLSGQPPAQQGRVYRAMNKLWPRRSNASTQGEPRIGRDDGGDPITGQLHRFTHGGGKDVDMLDPAARKQHLTDLAEDARAWSTGRHDPIYDGMAKLGQPILQSIKGATDSFKQDMDGLAQDAGAAVASSIDEDRDAFYAAINNERGATLGMVHQLMSLLRVG